MRNSFVMLRLKIIKSVCISAYLSVLLTGPDLFGQGVERTNDYFPPSPNAASLLRYASIPIDYYSGVPEIQVPLYSLPGQDVSIPVSLMYHASGIRVQDVASSYGLGWSLNAGGVITRIVRGKPDGNKLNCGNDQSVPNYWGYLTTGLCDSESDMFYFNFLGTAGKFALDETGAPYTIPFKHIKISPGTIPIGSPWSWTITDENGYQYFFGETAASRETTTTSITQNGAYVTDETYISTWYLTKIISPKGLQVATFTYFTGTSHYYENFRKVKKDIISQSTACSPVDAAAYDVNTKITINDPKYPVSATTNAGRVDFLFAPGRTDLLNGYSLSQISVFDFASTLVKRYTLQYSYFTGVNTQCAIPSPDYTGGPCSNQRLKLNSIKDENTNYFRQFTYNEQVDLPQRSSNYVDHWGYYNFNSTNYPGSTTSSWQYHTKIPYLNLSTPGTVLNGTSGSGLSTVSGIFVGGIKNADPVKAQANILTDIIYPTGGKTHFNYEGNLTESGQIGGGLRVQSIVDYESTTGNTIVSKRSYIYEQGRKYRDPVYHYAIRSVDVNTNQYSCFAPSFTFGLVAWCWGSCEMISLVRHSTSLNDLYDINGSNVGYGKVTEVALDNSKIERYFTNFEPNGGDTDPNTRPDSEPTITVYRGNTANNFFPTTIPGDSYGPPFAAKTSFAWERGLLLFERTYDDTQKLLTETEFRYDFNLPVAKTIQCRTVESSTQVGSQNGIQVFGSTFVDNLIRVGLYQIVVKPINLISKHYTTYGQTAISDVVPPTYPKVTVNVVVNKHSQFSEFVQSEETTLSDGAQKKIEYRYVFDLVSGSIPTPADEYSTAVWTLWNSNRIANPIEIISWYKKPGDSYKVVGAELVIYKIASSTQQAIPYAEYSLKLLQPLTDFIPCSVTYVSGVASFVKDNRYLQVSQYDHDNVTLNLVQLRSNSGVVHAFEWGYNNSLVSATYLNPGPTQMKTQYVHQPLIGVTKVIDPNLQSVNYSYDNLGRLQTIKDTDGSITARYRYNYAGSNEFAVDFSVSGNLLTGNQLTFQSTLDNQKYGSTTYLWDFGDGQVLEGTSAYATHTYSMPGTYNAKLSKINPEYSTVMTNKLIVVLSPPQVSVTVHNSSMDLCGVGPVPFITAASSLGCSGTYNYAWFVNTGSGGWNPVGTNSSTLTVDFITTVITPSFICRVTDSCGNLSANSNTVSINFYKSNPNCSPH